VSRLDQDQPLPDPGPGADGTGADGTGADGAVGVSVPADWPSRFKTLNEGTLGAALMIVGEASGNHTPIFADRIESLVFRPYWKLPLHVQKNEVLPDLRKDPRYLAKNHMEVVNSSGHIVDVLTPAVLQQIDSGRLAIRQQRVGSSGGELTCWRRLLSPAPTTS